ncbi:hypothetical protein [Dendronalium sp. ChiSLP03b]|uniref:hypothetical protein n=1 Tax=Dendronalium sp. ChiSLP03b TaxID=3075381 RepID=UPI00391B6C68
MSSSFYNYVRCIFNSRDNFNEWFSHLKLASQFDYLWTSHLDAKSTPPIDVTDLDIWKE